MTATDVMAAHAWPTNGHLIADVARLGYVTATDRTIDVTYGRGVWWKQWRPDDLTRVVHPSDPDHAPGDLEADFRELPFPDASFDVVAYDPPYMPAGGLGQYAGMHQRFGIGHYAQRPAAGRTRKEALLDLMRDGLTECTRIVRPGGILLVKAGRGIDGSALFRGDDRLVSHGESLGLDVVTQFVMLTRPRPQSHRGPQQNPRSNYSTLTVFRAPAVARVVPLFATGAA